MKIILANGCFDIFHIGHLLHLQEASRLAHVLNGRLFVALTVDSAVNKGPGLPVNSWADRAAVLRALRIVDEVVPSESCFDAIRRIRPVVFVKGIDYLDSPLLDEARAACNEVGAAVHITGTAKVSSRTIAEKMSADAGIVKVTVRFDGVVPPHAQGVSLLSFERYLRKITGLDCRVFKEKMGDDSKLRIKMTAAERERI